MQEIDRVKVQLKSDLMHHPMVKSNFHKYLKGQVSQVVQQQVTMEIIHMNREWYLVGDFVYLSFER